LKNAFVSVNVFYLLKFQLLQYIYAFDAQNCVKVPHADTW